MYYSHPCSYCTKVFYVFSDSKEHASRALYAGIKQHLTEYDEDRKEYKFDDGPVADSNEIYAGIGESEVPPAGGYELK